MLAARTRRRHILLARQIAIYLLRCDSGHNYSLQQIGHYLGGLSPATVLHSFRRIARQLPSDLVLRNLIGRFKEQL